MALGAGAAAGAAARGCSSCWPKAPPSAGAGAELSAARPTARCTCPRTIGDYTDFYAGIHHAMNVGKQFRPDNPLLPNYKYVPIGYHGRGLVDAPLRRDGAPPERAAQGRRRCRRARASARPAGSTTNSSSASGSDRATSWASRSRSRGAAEHIAGFCLLNDWSARDIQAWEYQPLGPFLAKNFATSISPWVVTPEALAPFRIPQPPRPDGDPAPLRLPGRRGRPARGRPGHRTGGAAADANA